MPRLWGAPAPQETGNEDRQDGGWEWFERAETVPPDGLAEVAIAFARCFSGRPGERALGHLRRLTQERHLGPEAGEAALRHLEGQRQLVAYIASLVQRGRDGG